MVSQRVEQVIIKPSSGVEVEAAIFQPADGEPSPDITMPPWASTLPYKFFVGFAPPGVDVVVSLKDAYGREVARDSWDANL